MLKLLKPNKTGLFDIYDNLDHVLHFCASTNVIKETGTGATSATGKLTKMVINCFLSTSPEDLWHYARQLIDSPPLPGYITKNGPYLENGGGGRQEIIICYEFDKSKFVEAMENICKQLGSFRDVPEFALFADLYNLHPYYVILEKAGQV